MVFVATREKRNAGRETEKEGAREEEKERKGRKMEGKKEAEENEYGRS